MSEEMVDAVIAARYLAKGEKNWHDVCKRVSSFIAEDKCEEEEFYKMMYTGTFLPNSPTLMNAGTKIGQLSACFVLPVKDDMGGIFDALKWTALIHKSGGGTGFNFSNLRSEGTHVGSTNGIASGPLSFMRVFNEATEAIKQGGKRRGANMGILNISHPDIEKFITCKHQEGKLSNFNLSIMIDDEFMEKVKAGNKEACELFDKIIENQWNNGEPSFLFYDNINKTSNTPELGPIEATNPCVTGDTLLLTKYGYEPIGSLVGVYLPIWNGYEWSMVTPQKTGINQELCKITFSDGSEVRCTPYHKFVCIEEGEKYRVEARELHIGETLVKFDFPVIQGKHILCNAYTHGFFSGDGSVDNRNRIYLYGVKKELLNLLTFKSIWNCNGRDVIQLPDGVIWNKTFVPDTYYDIESRLVWLAGLIDSNGCQVNGSIQISSVDKDFLQRVKYMLHTLGVTGVLSIMKKACCKSMPDENGGQKEYDCQECYRISIAASDMQKLYNLGLDTHRVKITIVPDRESKQFIKVKSIEMLEEREDVFCLMEPKNHSMILNGILTSNCGEQPLYPFESCNLGSINLTKFVDSESRFDFESLRDTVIFAVKFLDNVISINKYPLPAIKNASLKTRKIGLGVMGFHDALIMMGVPYDSTRAVELAEKIMGYISNVARDASEFLGNEYGVAPYYNLYKGAKTPRRNTNLTCIAPTGSISILAKCWSGIEPAIWVMQRNNTVNKSFYVIHPLFERMIREQAKEQNKTEEDVQQAFANVHKTGSINSVSWLPKKIKRLYKSAFDLTPKEHLDIVIAFQKNVDAAVSKTVNMPFESTKDDFKTAVFYAWENGLKGVTLYRTGSRQDEVLTLSEKKSETQGKEIISTERLPFFDSETEEWRWLPKRPKILNSYGIKKMRSGCGDIMIDISELEGKPYECLGDYTLGSGGCDAMFRTVRVLMGLCFRWGVPTWDIVKNLKAIKCDVALYKYKNGEADGTSCANCIARYLEENLPDDIEDFAYPFKNGKKEEFLRKHGLIMSSLPVDKPKEKKTISCPDCGSEIVMEEGCRKCHNCGWSQC